MISIFYSDVDEYYEDPAARFPPSEEIESNNTQPASTSNIPHVYGGQDGTIEPIHPTSRSERLKRNFLESCFFFFHLDHHQHRHGSSTHSSYRRRSPSDNPRHSFSSMHSGNNGHNRHPNNNNNFNKETQRAILTALTKLQRDVNNILERLNRLETSTHFLQQVNLLIFSKI